jgi:hypothetical protein
VLAIHCREDVVLCKPAPHGAVPRRPIAKLMGSPVAVHELAHGVGDRKANNRCKYGVKQCFRARMSVGHQDKNCQKGSYPKEDTLPRRPDLKCHPERRNFLHKPPPVGHEMLPPMRSLMARVTRGSIRRPLGDCPATPRTLGRELSKQLVNGPLPIGCPGNARNALPMLSGRVRCPSSKTIAPPPPGRNPRTAVAPPPACRPGLSVNLQMRS